MMKDSAQQPKAEWFEEPKEDLKGQTVRFGCGFMPHLFRRGFCMKECKNPLLMEKGLLQS